MLRSSAIGRVFFFALVLSFAAHASGCADDGAEEIPPGAMRGTLMTFVATGEGGTNETLYFLRRAGHAELLPSDPRVIFTHDPQLAPGTQIDIWGSEQAGELRAVRFAPVRSRSAVEANRRALINPTPVRPRTFAFVLVDIGGGMNLAAAEATRRLFGTGPMDQSTKQFYVEASYGKLDLGGQVFGPFKTELADCQIASLSKMVSQLRPMIQGTFDHYLWYFGSKNQSCMWSGLAASGTPDRPSRDTWYNASTSCVVVLQEPGHNFGMRHSSSMRCGAQSFLDAPMGSCTHSEYGDPYDPMGRGCRHMNGYHKAYEGWLGGCNFVEVFKSGTFKLVPMELPCNGVQTLQIAMPKKRLFAHSGGGGAPTMTELTHYYLELRTPRGFDVGVNPMVQLRVSGDVRERNQRGYSTWVLDMKPATAMTVDGIALGETYTDPAGGLSFTVEALNASQATVKIVLANEGTSEPQCIGGGTLQGSGPGIESCAAAPAVTGLMSMPRPDGGAALNADAGAGRDMGTATGAGGSRGTGGTVTTSTGAGGAAVADASASGGRAGTSGGGGMTGGGSPVPGVGEGPGALTETPLGPSDAGSTARSDAARPSPSSDDFIANTDDGGCGCHLGGTRRRELGGAGVLLGLGAIALRRRRKR